MKFIKFVPRIHKNKIPARQISNIGIKSTQSLLNIKKNLIKLNISNLYSRKKESKAVSYTYLFQELGWIIK